MPYGVEGRVQKLTSAPQPTARQNRLLLSPGSHEHSDNTSNPKWHARNHLHSLNWENPFSLMRLTSALNSISGHFGVTLQHNGMAYQGTTILVVLWFICAHPFSLSSAHLSNLSSCIQSIYRRTGKSMLQNFLMQNASELVLFIFGVWHLFWPKALNFYTLSMLQTFRRGVQLLFYKIWRTIKWAKNTVP